MLVVSDVHGAYQAMRRVIEAGEPVLILGDLVNLTDYRTGEGVIADVLGIDFARASATARGEADFEAMRRLWASQLGGDFESVRARIARAIEAQYAEWARILEGGTGYVIHGNVDRPSLMRAALPDGFRYVHGEVVEIGGRRIGFVGGGVETPLHAEGEILDSEMEEALAQLGEVDVLCTHVPPSVAPLRRDVVTGRDERGSAPVLDYLMRARPRLHLFGDVHQPQARTWRIGRTRCVNVGYFRATGRPYRLDLAEL